MTNDPQDSRIRLGAVMWMLSVQFFVMQGIVQLGWSTPFSLKHNFISDLGNTVCAPYPPGSSMFVCSPWHAWMNASFIALGLTKIAGAALVPSAFRPGVLRVAGLGLLAVAGAGDILVGLYPENVAIGPHKIGAGLTFLGGNLAIALLGAAILVQSGSRALGWFAIIAGIAGLIATVLLVRNVFLGLGVGGMERIAAYAVPLFLVAAGAHVWHRRSTA